MGLPRLLAEVSGGGFAGSPDVPANVTAAIVCPPYAGMHRVECETSGPGRLREGGNEKNGGAGRPGRPAPVMRCMGGPALPENEQRRIRKLR
jgi:hypothetical protein